MSELNFIVNCIPLIAIYPFLTGYTMANPLMECGMEETMEQLGRTFFADQPWPKGRIPFVIESSLRPPDRKMLQGAIDDFHKYTCVRFRPKTNQDKDYMTVRMSFNTSRCGTAVRCYYKGQGAHFAQISGSCSSQRWIWVHELSHILCLGHEQSRSDRNQFLSYEDCANSSHIAPIPYKQTLRGQIYDYSSVMHYSCNGRCSGRPTMSPKFVKRCGPDVSGRRTAGLSLLDIEKINEYYECYYGCKRHRWYNVHNLTQSQMRSVVNFASREGEGDDEPVYLCRGYNWGDIAVGWYRPQAKLCQISNEGHTFNVTEHIQLFALPRGTSKITRDSTPYRLYSNADKTKVSEYLQVGRRVDNSPIFAARGEVRGENGKLKTVVGRVDSNNLGVAYPPGLESMGIFLIDEFDTIGCTEK